MHLNRSILRTLKHSIAVLALSSVGCLGSNAQAQNASHPDAKSPLPENPYIKHTDPWRWDIRTQLFLRTGVFYFSNTDYRDNTNTEQAATRRWALADLEIIYPVVRDGGFYWSPNEKVTASIRAGDFVLDAKRTRLYTKDTKSEYTSWKMKGIDQYVRQIHVTMLSHIVTSDVIFDQTKARQLPWPDKWSDEKANSFLSPVVDSVGKAVSPDGEDTIKTLLDFWVDGKDPKLIPELDLVKFLTGKVIEHVQVRTPPSELSSRSGNRISAAAFIGSANWSGFIVRSADVVAREPEGNGSKHDLATLLTAVLRSAGVPARTVLCVNQREDDIIEKMVSLVEFAMYDPERDLTFWVPIDVDRLRLNGKRASQYTQWWNYFGTNDKLNDYVPVAYYFHPPASYRAFDLPALYGLRSSIPLPEYVIQSLLIDPIVSPVVNPPETYPSKSNP